MVYKTEGIVLRTRSLGEADKIVTMYTRAKGKVVGVARGARRIRNRLLGSTQAFTHGRYILFAGKGMDTVSQGEIIQSYQSLRDDLDLMGYAAYAVELLDVLTEEGEPHEEVFFLLAATLALGAAGRFNLALPAYELKLMRYLGYEPRLYSCLQCDQEIKENFAFTRQGGVVCSNCRQQFADSQPLSKGTWELMKRFLDINYSRISILHPSRPMLNELESLMRRYIEFRIDRPLKSLAFLSTIKDIPTPEVKTYDR